MIVNSRLRFHNYYKQGHPTQRVRVWIVPPMDEALMWKIERLMVYLTGNEWVSILSISTYFIASPFVEYNIQVVFMCEYCNVERLTQWEQVRGV